MKMGKNRGKKTGWNDRDRHKIWNDRKKLEKMTEKVMTGVSNGLTRK